MEQFSYHLAIQMLNSALLRQIVIYEWDFYAYFIAPKHCAI